MSAIEKECADRTHNRCDVVTLYHGGVYDLYTYKKYTDVRLVFAPEFQIAFFGGDPDNFEFPRYDLDVAYFRVYDNGAALSPEHYFKWSPNGARDGELVFVSGNPAGTSRLDTVAELRFTRDIAQPYETQNRAVSVHSAALIEALRHVYDAGALADELQAPVGKKHASR
jgi:hypothetical protein